jgi:hypothetical protein
VTQQQSALGQKEKPTVSRITNSSPAYLRHASRIYPSCISSEIQYGYDLTESIPGGRKLLGLFASPPPLCLSDPYHKPSIPFKPGRQMQAFSGGGHAIHRGEVVGSRRLAGNLSNPPPLCLGDPYIRPPPISERAAAARECCRRETLRLNIPGQPFLFGDPFGYPSTSRDVHGGPGRHHGRQMGVSPPAPRSPVWGAAKRPTPTQSTCLYYVSVCGEPRRSAASLPALPASNPRPGPVIFFMFLGLRRRVFVQAWPPETDGGAISRRCVLPHFGGFEIGSIKVGRSYRRTSCDPPYNLKSAPAPGGPAAHSSTESIMTRRVLQPSPLAAAFGARDRL